jgi:spermidine/putrescine transport system permease protein
VKASTRGKVAETGVTLPSLVWLGLLFVIPVVLVFAIMFRAPTPDGGFSKEWTLATVRTLFDSYYVDIIWRTIWMSFAATAACILLSTPMGYYLAKADESKRRWVLLLVILPFWTSFLVRIFAWKVLLHPDGFIKHFLVWAHLVEPDALLLYNVWAVLLVMVYTELPFALLPIYAASEKFDFRLLEAAKDLGCHSFRAFCSVFVPGIRVGIMTAFLMVFIPSLGSYVVPDLVGGTTSEMLGNKIAQYTFVDRNLPRAAGLSAVLTLTVLGPMLVYMLLRRKNRGAGGGAAAVAAEGGL